MENMENIKSDEKLHLWHGDELYVATVFHLVALNQGHGLRHYYAMSLLIGKKAMSTITRVDQAQSMP